MSAMKFTITTTKGENFEAHVIVGDLARYDILRNRLNWPGREGNEFLFMCLASFCALLRTGQIPNETKPEAFIDTIETLEPIEDSTEDAEFPAGN